MAFGLDPSIALGFKPTEPAPDALEAFQRVQQIQQAQRQAQMAPIQMQQAQAALQGQDLKNQEDQNRLHVAAEDRTDSEYMNKAENDAVAASKESGKPIDFDALSSQVASNVKGRNAAQFEVRMKNRAAALKSVQTEDAVKQKDQLKDIGNHIDSLFNLKPEDRAAAYPAEIEALQAKGYDVSKLPTTYPGDEALAQMASANLGGQVHLENELHRREIADKELKAKTDKETADNKSRQEARVEANNKYANVTDQASHDAWLKTLPASIRSEYSQVYDPNTSAALVARKARTVSEQDKVDKPDTNITGVEPYLIAIKGNPANAKRQPWELMDMALKARDAAEIAKHTAEKGSGTKTPTNTQFMGVENTKQTALKQSKAKLQADLAKAAGDEELIGQAWENHRERAQQAQNAYESKLGVLKGEELADHFEYPTAQDMRGVGPVAATVAAPAVAAPPVAAPGAVSLGSATVNGPRQGQSTTATPPVNFPPRPATIPQQARAQYNPDTKQWRYSIDDGNSWQITK